MPVLYSLVILVGCNGEGTTQPVSPPAIVFTSDRISYEESSIYNNKRFIPEIYLMNLDGTEVVRLTKTVGPESSVAWSPDGKRIAFDWDNLDKDDKTSIYVMDADGKNKVRLTDKTT